MFQIPFVKLLALSLVILSLGGILSACGKEDAKPVRIGIVLGVNSFKKVTDSFKQTFIERGYVEGETIFFDYVAGNGNRQAMREACERFAAEEFNLVFATTNGAAKECKTALNDTGIPLVFAIVMSPLEAGIVDSLEAPSGNVTGIRNALSDFVGKRIEILQKLAPTVKTVWIPITPSYPTTKSFLPPVQSAAHEFGMTLQADELDTPEKIIAFLDAQSAPTFDAIMLPPNPAPQVKSAFDAIVAYSKRHNIPVVANSAKNLEAGCLFSYHIDMREEGKIAAIIADRILTDDERIPYPVINSDPVLHINARAAARHNLTISEDLRSFGQVVFE